MTAPRPPYPECREPFTWPVPGKPTWKAPPQSFFGDCTGDASCEVRSACPVGVPLTLGSRGACCDCACHDDRRKQLAK